MHDLLNEDEFVKKVTHNHWKTFRVFYALPVLHYIIIAIIGFIDIDIHELIITTFTVMIPMVVVYIMGLYPKNVNTPLKSMALAICIVLSLYYVPPIAICIYLNESRELIVDFVGAYIILCAVWCFIILSKINRKQKRLRVTGNH